MRKHDYDVPSEARVFAGLEVEFVDCPFREGFSVFCYGCIVCPHGVHVPLTRGEKPYKVTGDRYECEACAAQYRDTVALEAEVKALLKGLGRPRKHAASVAVELLAA